MGMLEIPAVRQFPPGPLEDSVGVLGSWRALVLCCGESGAQAEATGGDGSKNDVHLSGLVALSGFQELEEEGTDVGGQAPGWGGCW
jgi:hypothetical protein